MAAGRAAVVTDGSFTGAVLCGGSSRRMGRDKASLLVAGTPMARRVADALLTAGAMRVDAIGGDAVVLGALGLHVVSDDEPGGGPLPATITALLGAETPVVMVMACDLLRPSPEAILTVVDALRSAAPHVCGAVPVVDGVHQWTHAAWRRSASDQLSKARAGGARSLRRAGGSLPVIEVLGLDPAAVADADTPAMLPTGSPWDPSRGTSLPAMEPPEIDVAALAARGSASAPLVDVRELHEYIDGHVPGAVHIPLGEVAERIDEVPTDGVVYVICASGGRSARAAAHYRSAGIDAVNVSGGTTAWVDAGNPIDRGPHDGGS